MQLRPRDITWGSGAWGGEASSSRSHFGSAFPISLRRAAIPATSTSATHVRDPSDPISTLCPGGWDRSAFLLWCQARFWSGATARGGALGPHPEGSRIVTPPDFRGHSEAVRSGHASWDCHSPGRATSTSSLVPLNFGFGTCGSAPGRSRGSSYHTTASCSEGNRSEAQKFTNANFTVSERPRWHYQNTRF